MHSQPEKAEPSEDTPDEMGIVVVDTPTRITYGTTPPVSTGQLSIFAPPYQPKGSVVIPASEPPVTHHSPYLVATPEHNVSPVNVQSTEGIMVTQHHQNNIMVQGMMPNSVLLVQQVSPKVEGMPFMQPGVMMSSCQGSPVPGDVPQVVQQEHTNVEEPGKDMVPVLFKEPDGSDKTLKPYLSPDGVLYSAMEIGERMEIVWHGEFDKLFSTFASNYWSLEPVTEAPSGSEWRIFKDSAKVRFLCQSCGHGWTSMKGRVMFWFHFNAATQRGQVLFCLFGQKCSTCKTDNFEHAMWYPEEVIKVIGNLYNYVGQIYYGFIRPPIRVDRRQGRPRQQHNKDLCQACQKGMCREEWKLS